MQPCFFCDRRCRSWGTFVSHLMKDHRPELLLAGVHVGPATYKVGVTVDHGPYVVTRRETRKVGNQWYEFDADGYYEWERERTIFNTIARCNVACFCKSVMPKADFATHLNEGHFDELLDKYEGALSRTKEAMVGSVRLRSDAKV